jgi:hypothetical protein
MDQSDEPMISVETLQFELHGRLDDLLPTTGKTNISVRWEPVARIARVGVSIDEYTWEHRMQVLERLLDFERAHKDDLAMEFDIIPLMAIEDESFAEV